MRRDAVIFGIDGVLATALLWILLGSPAIDDPHASQTAAAESRIATQPEPAMNVGSAPGTPSLQGHRTNESLRVDAARRGELRLRFATPDGWPRESVRVQFRAEGADTPFASAWTDREGRVSMEMSLRTTYVRVGQETPWVFSPSEIHATTGTCLEYYLGFRANRVFERRFVDAETGAPLHRCRFTARYNRFQTDRVRMAPRDRYRLTRAALLTDPLVEAETWVSASRTHRESMTVHGMRTKTDARIPVVAIIPVRRRIEPRVEHATLPPEPGAGEKRLRIGESVVPGRVRPRRQHAAIAWRIVDADERPLPYASFELQHQKPYGEAGDGWVDVSDGERRIDNFVDVDGRRTLACVRPGTIRAVVRWRGRRHILALDLRPDQSVEITVQFPLRRGP